jgi:hypothetical protein
MRRLLCWIGWHRYVWLRFGYVCELWACECGKTIIQFAEEPRALSEVEYLNACMQRPSSKVNR